MHTQTHKIDRVVLSHWHSDHSGGMLSFLRLRAQDVHEHAKHAAPCVVDLHPSRPLARGISSQGNVIARLPPDPTFEQIKAVGGVPETHAEGHAVAGGTVWVSGEIPRLTEFEDGLPGGVRWIEQEDGKGGWAEEQVRLAVLSVCANIEGESPAASNGRAVCCDRCGRQGSHHLLGVRAADATRPPAWY